MNKAIPAILFLLVAVTPAFGYIDPGTGSMLFSLLTGVAVTVFFFLKNLVLRIKTFSLGGSKQVRVARQTFVVYSEGKQYWNVFSPILEEFDRRGIPCLYCSSGEDDPGLDFKSGCVSTKFIGTGNRAYRFMNFLEADVCLMTTPGLDVLQLKRSPGVSHYAHILHAVTDATLYRLFSFDYFDSLLLTGPYQVADLRELEALRGTRTKRLEVVGCTYLDVLAAKLRDTKTDLKEKTVLVAPSWGSNGILSRFGMKLLAPLADSGYRVIIRPHPQSVISEKEMLDTLYKQLEGRPNVEWNFERENLAAMARSNVLISDFSGIIFDFAFLFGRPILYPQFDFDPRPYDAADLDGELWTFRTLREIGEVLDEADFPRIGNALDALQTAERRSPAIERARAEAYGNPGSAGKRTVDVLVEIRDHLMKERA